MAGDLLELPHPSPPTGSSSAASKPLPAIPPPVPPKSAFKSKPLPPVPTTIDDDDGELSDDDAPLLNDSDSGPDEGEEDFYLRPYGKPAASYVAVLHTFSGVFSASALVLLAWSYHISKYEPLSESGRERQLASYTDSLGLTQVMILTGVNIVWSCFILYFARKGTYNRLLFLNIIYDFAQWALLISFSVVGLLTRLWDRRLCEFSPNEEDLEYKGELCEEASYKLLCFEITALGLALLVAVLHFILLVARCCLDVPSAWRSMHDAEYELTESPTQHRRPRWRNDRVLYTEIYVGTAEEPPVIADPPKKKGRFGGGKKVHWAADILSGEEGAIRL